jgi:hypothetical protein
MDGSTPIAGTGQTAIPTEKFSHPDITAKGEARARVPLKGVETLWFNTGTLCNIQCENCYILSSPTNDALVYLTTAEVSDYLEQIESRRAAGSTRWPVQEIGFTGGEPFMNPEMIEITENTLSRGYQALVLTNAMAPMMRPRVQKGLLSLRDRYGDALTLRISIDHHTAELHDRERGEGSFAKMMEGMRWLADNGFHLDAAGRTCWGEDEGAARQGYATLFADTNVAIDAHDPSRCILFPEMDASTDVPEITGACWKILGKSPADIMCATSRMVVKRKGADAPAVLACTLLPYAEEFELGPTLEDAEKPIKLNHPHCAKFCVLGGGSCSA